MLNILFPRPALAIQTTYLHSEELSFWPDTMSFMLFLYDSVSGPHLLWSFSYSRSLETRYKEGTYGEDFRYEMDWYRLKQSLFVKFGARSPPRSLSLLSWFSPLISSSLVGSSSLISLDKSSSEQDKWKDN